MAANTFVFIGTETTANPRHRAGQLWHACLISRRPGESDTQHVLYVRDVDTATADRAWLIESNFHARNSEPYYAGHALDSREVASSIVKLTRGAVVVSADEFVLQGRLEAFIRDEGYCPAWADIVDIRSYAAGHLNMPPPVELEAASDLLWLTHDWQGPSQAMYRAGLCADVYQATTALHRERR